MEIGTCPRCAAAYTVAEVNGLGILRARPESAGGPFVEYRCAACARLIRLVPHGHGRYAPPGEAPPPAAPEAARRPAWAEAEPAQPDAGEAAEAPPPPRRDPDPEPEPIEIALEDDLAPLGVAEAARILGVAVTADVTALERAFRERSLTCHPDKVAHLDADFQDLARRKFLRLRRAYDLLRGLHEGTP